MTSWEGRQLQRRAFFRTVMGTLVSGLTISKSDAFGGEPRSLSYPSSKRGVSGPPDHPVTVARDVETSMRDGTVLRSDIYYPDSNKPVPVLIQRTPYDKKNFQELAEDFAKQGFITVIQDVRGQFESDGIFTPWENEGDDGFDTIEWAANLPGANGKVATFGSSYAAACQWQAALRRPPHLKAMVCAVSPADYFDQWVFPGGAFALSFTTTWLLRNVARSAAKRLPDGFEIEEVMRKAYEENLDTLFRNYRPREFYPLFPDRPDVAPYFWSWINNHSTRDSYWQGLSVRGRHSLINVPVLQFGGWYDVFIDGTLENFSSMQAHGGSSEARQGSQIVVGPWAHSNWGTRLGDRDFGAAAADCYPEVASAFLNRWLKDAPSDGKPNAVRYFLMGKDQWEESPSWPPPGIRPQRLYLSGKGRANGSISDGQLIDEPAEGWRVDSYRYDPANPVPSVGGHGCCYPPAPFGPRDQSDVEARPDVLVYTTEPLRKPLEVVGPVTLELYASSTARDTDFTAKLVEVDEAGKPINISEGIIRTRFRESMSEPEPMVPGKVYRILIKLHATANRFKQNHRIRLEVSSSNFTIYDVNFNTWNGMPGDLTDKRACTQRIFHGGEFPSCLVLSAREA